LLLGKGPPFTTTVLGKDRGEKTISFQRKGIFLSP
jgi:hypothetical protein